ncbi:sulfotransferase [Nocardioides sp. GBK3QG-3]|uniref:Sulfotransferase n=2 Tax=Nocardioides mangrovi TaxID=2874580 RepID=A0ABS7UE17_9ACTN|nr:sulfotransferase [Nocardioides mangrovi]
MSDTPRPPLRFGFMIAGTQKAGTSSLSKLLDRHPQIVRAPRKEMHFFDNESLDWERPDYSSYEVAPLRPRHRLVGDATPLYLWWPQALERIRAYNPDMKFIVLFRDPIERLFSQWQMVLNRWPDQAPSWSTFLTRFAPDGLEDRIPPKTNVHAYRMQSGVVRGYYGAQLERGYEMFGRERFHVVEFRHFVSDHGPVVDAITDFLGIQRYREQPALPHALPGKPAVADSAPTADDIAALAERYRDDFALFERLSGLELGAWPLRQILAGELSPADYAAKLAAKVTSPQAG